MFKQVFADGALSLGRVLEWQKLSEGLEAVENDEPIGGPVTDCTNRRKFSAKNWNFAESPTSEHWNDHGHEEK